MEAGSGQPPAPRFPQSVDDIKLKGINPMALAIDIKVSYGTAQRVKLLNLGMRIQWVLLLILEHH